MSNTARIPPEKSAPGNSHSRHQGQSEDTYKIVIDTWGLDKMADILQTTFLYAFPWQKIVCFDSSSTEVCS